MTILHTIAKGFFSFTDIFSGKGVSMQQVRNGRKAAFAFFILLSLIVLLFISMFTVKNLSDAAFIAVIGGITGTFTSYCASNVASKKYEKKNCPEGEPTATPTPPSA